MSDSMRQTVIVGSGPAGLTAAIYAARASLRPVVLAGSTPGGQLTKTSEVENYPGFAKGIDGPILMSEMLEQAKWCGAELVWESLARLERDGGTFRAHSDGGQVFTTRTLIYATGASPRLLGVKGELDFQPPRGTGVTYCAVCDGNFYRKLPVAVVGGGDSAMEEATYLSNLCAEVTLVHRREVLRASKVMVARARAKRNIRWELNQVVEEILGDPKRKPLPVVTGMRIKDTRDGSTRELRLAGVFGAIGHIPTTAVLKGVVALDADGYIKVDERQATSVEGLFAAGDCHDRTYRQAVTAAGMGCKAALEAERYLARLGVD